MHDCPPFQPIYMRSKTSGFSLIELLVVIAIMAILAGVVAINVMDKPGKAKIIAAKTQIRILQTAVQVYRTEQGRIPTLEQGLRALVEKTAIPPLPERFPQDGYIEGITVPRDPWGNEYIYVAPGRSGASFEIISYGSDGEPGGSEDAIDLSSAELGT